MLCQPAHSSSSSPEVGSGAFTLSSTSRPRPCTPDQSCTCKLLQNFFHTPAPFLHTAQEPPSTSLGWEPHPPGHLGRCHPTSTYLGQHLPAFHQELSSRVGSSSFTTHMALAMPALPPESASPAVSFGSRPGRFSAERAAPTQLGWTGWRGGALSNLCPKTLGERLRRGTGCTRHRKAKT